MRILPIQALACVFMSVWSSIASTPYEGSTGTGEISSKTAGQSRRQESVHWKDRPYLNYSIDEYMVAVGEGRNRGEAGDKALASLAKAIHIQVEAQTTIRQEYVSDAHREWYVNQVSRTVATRTEATLSGATAVDHCEEGGRHFARVVMNRRRAALLIRSKTTSYLESLEGETSESIAAWPIADLIEERSSSLGILAMASTLLTVAPPGDEARDVKLHTDALKLQRLLNEAARERANALEMKLLSDAPLKCEYNQENPEIAVRVLQRDSAQDEVVAVVGLALNFRTNPLFVTLGAQQKVTDFAGKAVAPVVSYCDAVGGRRIPVTIDIEGLPEAPPLVCDVEVPDRGRQRVGIHIDLAGRALSPLSAAEGAQLLAGDIQSSVARLGFTVVGPSEHAAYLVRVYCRTDHNRPHSNYHTMSGNVSIIANGEIIRSWPLDRGEYINLMSWQTYSDATLQLLRIAKYSIGLDAESMLKSVYPCSDRR